MGRFAAVQRQRNLDSQNCWDLYQGHRAAVTAALLGESDSTTRRLCVLGAGNCNDLDLQTLGQRFAEITLVDVDSQALATGMSQQQVGPTGKIQACGGVDLTGVMSIADSWTPAVPPDEEEIAACIDRASLCALPAIGGPFDMAGSVCLLTQIIEMAVLALGPRHPQFNDLVFALRDRHLRMLAELVRPGGQGILITDFVSSDTIPHLANIPEARFEQEMTEQIRRGNFFTGANPFALRALLQNAPFLAPMVSGCQLTRPWRWFLGARVYAVSAIKFERNSN